MAKKRLYISADIEGVAGVVNKDQLMPGGFEYERAREWMTAEVVAACEGAFESGITEIVVSDSHGNGQNLLLDKIPDNVQVVRSWPRPLCMMEGIDVGAYVGAVLLGYHSGASDLSGVLAHTLHSRAISEIRLNGKVASETVISAATAAHFGVPTIMVSGDDAYVEHAHKVLGGSAYPLESVVSKWVSSMYSARMVKPKVVQDNIAKGVKVALSRLSEPDTFPVQRWPDPIELEIVCLQRKAVEILDYLPNVTRINANTIGFTAKDMVEASKFLQFLLSSGALTPA